MSYFKKHYSILSGILLAASFTIKGWNIVVFVALIPFIYKIFQTKNKKSFKREIFMFSYGYYLPLMAWIYTIRNLLPFSGGINLLLLVMLNVIIPAILGLITYWVTSTFVRLNKGEFRDVIYFALLYCLSEYILEIFPVISFPWGRIGTITATFKPFIQSASLFGGLFLSFLVLVCNGTIAYIIIHWGNIAKRDFMGIAIAVAIFGGNISFGYIRINNYDFSGETIEAVLVQGNYSGRVKWDSTAEEMSRTYLELAKQSINENTKLVVFPETAIAGRLDNDDYLTDMLKEFSVNNNVTLITGIINKSEGKYYNCAVAFQPDRTISDTYNKQSLVPFGEYIPFASIMPNRLMNGFTNFTAGETSFPIETAIGKVGDGYLLRIHLPQYLKKNRP